MRNATTTEIFIPKGTMVMQEWPGGRMVELLGDVYVDAIRQPDGGWLYTVAGREYYCCGLAEKSSFRVAGAAADTMLHVDGLVAFA